MPYSFHINFVVRIACFATGKSCLIIKSIYYPTLLSPPPVKSVRPISALLVPY